MKITKTQLRRIIAEELKALGESAMNPNQWGPSAATPYMGGEPERTVNSPPSRKTTSAQAKKQLSKMRGQGGVSAARITDEERQLMMDVLGALKNAAAGGNIASGMVTRRIELLMTVLEKIAGTPDVAPVTET